MREFIHRCFYCSEHLSVVDEMIGARLCCPHCDGKFTVDADDDELFLKSHPEDFQGSGGKNAPRAIVLRDVAARNRIFIDGKEIGALKRKPAFGLRTPSKYAAHRCGSVYRNRLRPGFAEDAIAGILIGLIVSIGILISVLSIWLSMDLHRGRAIFHVPVLLGLFVSFVVVFFSVSGVNRSSQRIR
ncbi:MAG: hypothetical protein NUW37_02195 [Planctomycetes bacterium]|nr:hypothetical protein [Planctomycetota bacterium]